MDIQTQQQQQQTLPTTLSVDAPCMRKECPERRQKPSTLNEVEFTQCVNKKGVKTTWQVRGKHAACGGKVQAFISNQLAQSLGLKEVPQQQAEEAATAECAPNADAPLSE